MMGIISSVTHLATSPNHKNDAITGALILMFGILFLRILIAWGVLLSPYKTFFTDGHREGDIIYKIYEYDPKYNEDKFYK
jgi:hypothetical protein